MLADKYCILLWPNSNLTFNTLPRHHALKISNWWVIHFMAGFCSRQILSTYIHVGNEMKAMLAHGCAFMAFTFTSIMVWRIKRDARVRWEVTNNRSAASQYEEVKAWMPTVTQLQGWITCSRVKFENLHPSLAAVVSATKPWIRFLIYRSTKRICVIVISNTYSGCRPRVSKLNAYINNTYSWLLSE